MSTNENASLVLNSVNASSTNSIKTSFTWANINLRSLLGDMYDRYDRFNLCLNTIAFNRINRCNKQSVFNSG